jgi:NDP-sugar pyrophosphorylase family protein
MIFAAGQGQRLRPITEKTPKALVPVAGRPMIEYPLRLLCHYGIRDIIVNLHHLGSEIEAYLGDGARFGLNIAYSHEAELLDTGGGLLKARPFFDQGTFLVINTDVIVDLRLSEVLEFHRKNGATATLVLRADDRADEYGSMDIDSAGRIYRFLQTQRREIADRTTKLMFTGVQILEPRVFDYMRHGAGQRFSTTRDVYPAMVVEEEPVFGYRFDGFWQDLGSSERIHSAERYLAANPAALHYL